MPLRLHKEISQSKNVIKCKHCKCLIMMRYVGDILCNQCEIQYKEIVNKILKS